MNQREEHDMYALTATPENPSLRTVGPWVLACGECGPLGVATTTAGVDNALIAHGRECHTSVGAR